MSYELLTVDTLAGYVATRPALARFGAVSDVREVGDGNLNLVFIAAAEHGGLVLKQALPYVRVDPTWPITPERNGIEGRALRVHNQVAPGLVPEIYDADPDRHVIAIEDLSDHRVWRGALNEGLRHEGVATELGRYVAKVAFGTSVFGLGAKGHKAALATAANPELCEITEDLVFTEPYIAHEHNRILPANEADVAAYAGDPEVRAAIGAAKFAFLTHAEALIHGDLHTGSVLVRDGSARAFDVEFAFYGPVGFDIGALWGNYVLAAARALVLGDDAHAGWALAQAGETWQAFADEFAELWPRRADPRIIDLDRHLDQVYADAVPFAAAKAARRVIGFSAVSDIQSLPEESRVRAIRAVLAAARLLLTAPGPRGEPKPLFERVGQVLAEAGG
ncbi:S-methyl-5-thioribose kinase [Nonomuraea glycinis]|uniref:S-methyl-5-thioribose kinase n=1 Tax=Nonomuraea glycinis TaxID=2047744 RepID=A0A918E4V8_9ACTN|nr:S-methyl-5-thioribose kinase [Nonomuraea glycinis]MCA2176241.1 S-methyl-5-thioribose kinase [Nonomuraea glycinis]GGP07566.1 methylthioribose kinase [Nonomuraea glycinis]